MGRDSLNCNVLLGHQIDSRSEACLFTIAGCLGYIIWRLSTHNSLLFLFLFKLFWWLQRDLLFCCLEVGLFEPQFPLRQPCFVGLELFGVYFQLGKWSYFLKVHFISLCTSLILFYGLVRRQYIGQDVKPSVICAKGLWVKGWNLGQGVKNKFYY